MSRSYRLAILTCLICWNPTGPATAKVWAPEQARLQTTDFGAEGGGLRCRVTFPTAIEQGAKLSVAIELLTISEKLGPRVAKLNSFMPGHQITVSLVEVTTGEVTTLRPYDAGLGISDDGQKMLPLDGRQIGPWQAQLSLAGLPPGMYQGQAIFSYPGGGSGGIARTRELMDDPTCWNGVVKSPLFRLRVREESARHHTFLLPKRLRLLKGGVINYTEEDAEAVRVQLRNGYHIGTYCYHGKSGYSLRSGSPEPGVKYPIVDRLRDHKGDFKASYTIEVFETASAPRHKWMPGHGSGGYRILFRRTFDLSLTEKEIRAQQ